MRPFDGAHGESVSITVREMRLTVDIPLDMFDELRQTSLRADVPLDHLISGALCLASRTLRHRVRGDTVPVGAAAQPWHHRGMARARISTTVDRELLETARRARASNSDAELIDEALAALLARDRAAEIDAEYAAGYAEHPLDEPDEWGDLASFRDAVGR